MSDLLKSGITKIEKKGCSCNKTYLTLIYKIPIKLDVDIVGFLSSLGKPSVPFRKTSVLKIENGRYSISGIKRLREVKFILKKSRDDNALIEFENGLVNYVNSKK